MAASHECHATRHASKAFYAELAPLASSAFRHGNRNLESLSKTFPGCARAATTLQAVISQYANSMIVMMQPNDTCETADVFDGLGLFDIPAGRIATVVTYLEMTSHPAVIDPAIAELRLDRVRRGDSERHRSMFRRIGERWIWTSRLLMSAEELGAVLDAPQTHSFLVVVAGEDAGLFEVQFRPDEAELTFLGLDHPWTGRGIGPVLIVKAAQMAFAAGCKRLMVHTCHFDDPRALGFYQRMGFKPYKIAVEIMADPRLSGVLAEAAAPHIPCITGETLA